MSPTNRPEVVVVTGASGGVGRAVAHAFGKRGAHVALSGQLLSSVTTGGTVTWAGASTAPPS